MRRADKTGLTERSRGGGRSALVALAVAVALHALVAVVWLPDIIADWTRVPEPAPQEEEEEFRVETTVEPAEPQLADERPEEAVERPEALPDEPAPEPQRDEERPKPKPAQIDRKIVEQQTNEQTPDEAKFLSSKANKTDRETRARETTTEEVPPAPQPPDEPKPTEQQEAPQTPEPPGAMAAKSPQPRAEQAAPKPPPQPERPQAEDRPAAQAEVGVEQARPQKEQPPVVREQTPRVDPSKLFNPSVEDYEKLMGERDEALAERVEDQPRGRRILGDFEERKKAVRASLENYITEIQPGNHTSVNAHASIYAEYIGRIHRKIHARWGAGFLPQLDSNFPLHHPLNNPKLNTVLEFVIRADDGKVESVNIVDGSGETMYDAEAVTIAYTVGPHPGAPDEIISPNGRVYIHWNFWRDQRQCGPFGASVFVLDGLEDAGGPAGRSGGRPPAR